MNFKSLILILFPVILLGCGTPQANVKKFGNLEIYYGKDVPVDYVTALGTFFKERGLINPDQTHSMKLVGTSRSYILKMILNSDLESVPEDKLVEIIYLEREIDSVVFDTPYVDVDFEIQITDAYFNPLITK